MGHFKVEAELCWREKCVSRELFVDTGSTLTTISRETAEKLGLPILARNYEFETPTGIVRHDIAAAEIRINGRHFTVLVGVADGIEEEVLGVNTLELLGFIVDPINKKLIKTEYYPPKR